MPGLRIGTRCLIACLFLCVPALAIAQEKPLRTVIDTEIKKGWQADKIAAPGLSSDSVFVRRIYLDLVGTIPSYEETTSFLKDSDPKKREKLIDKLLDDPRYSTQRAHVWDLVLFGRNPQNIEATRKRDGFKQWLAGQFAKNEPYDRIVRNLLTAEQEGSELFYVQYRNQPEEATTAITRVFLGTQLQCARCHDHPFENWTQKDFYGMAGFFVRLVVVDAGGTATNKKYKIAEKSTGDVLFSGSVKDQKPGQKGEPVKPKFLGGLELKEPEMPKGFKEPEFKGNANPAKPKFSRKEKLVEWLTAVENPYFARAVANRVWGQFMGRGFVHPVDDLSEKNEPSHPELLKAITEGLIAHKFDMKWLIRELVNSETYQLGDAGVVTEAMPKKYERARVRPLSAEEIMASLRVATGTSAEMLKAGGDSSEYYLRYFGEPNDGQGDFQGSLSEHLFLNNAPQIRTLLQARKGNLSDSIQTSKEKWEDKVDRMFLSVLSRTPSAAERERFVKHLTSGDAKMTPALVEEALWVLVSCSEFRFNH